MPTLYVLYYKLSVQLSVQIENLGGGGTCPRCPRFLHLCGIDVRISNVFSNSVELNCMQIISPFLPPLKTLQLMIDIVAQYATKCIGIGTGGRGGAGPSTPPPPIF